MKLHVYLVTQDGEVIERRLPTNLAMPRFLLPIVGALMRMAPGSTIVWTEPQERGNEVTTFTLDRS